MRNSLKEALKDSEDAPIASVFRPFQKFFEIKEAGGILLITCALIALVWANSAWSASYTTLWQTEVGLSIGTLEFKHTLLHWINDGLMTLFFLFVGLEIKREILVGELSSWRLATLPLAAALGGMVVPAILYTAMNLNSPTLRGWGIPMATDIAFALGILGLLGKRIPLGLTVFLAALAIADDLGAIVVIAAFYTSELSIAAIVAAACTLLLLVIANRAGVRSMLLYVVLGIVTWVCVLNSGIHASIAGVLLAMTIPARARIRTTQFVRHSRALIAGTPLGRIEHSLYPWVSFLILPVFALANAGVVLNADISTIVTSSVTVGIVLGLFLGKPIGILLFAWIVVKLNLTQLPANVSWRHLQGVALLAGIGFTMSIFIATLAFADPTLLLQAKVGVLLASTAAAVGGWLLLRKVKAQ